MTKRRGKKLSYKNKAKGEPQKQGLLVILSVSEVSTKLKRGFFATLKMTSGTAQAHAHAKQRQKRPLRQKPSKAKSQLKSALTRATKASQAHAKQRQKRSLQHKFLVANSLLKELAAQKRKGHEMKKFLILITLVLFSAGFITEAFAAPARGGGLLKE